MVNHIIARWIHRWICSNKRPTSIESFQCHHVQIPTRDGHTLLADHYWPQHDARHTIVIRTPYGRSPWWIFPSPLLYVAHGYHVVVVSVRGTAGSSGLFRPGRHERDDGVDTLTWVHQQPWHQGKCILMGMSYAGLTSWALLDTGLSSVDGAIMVAAPHDLGLSVWDSGAFRFGDVFSWSYVMKALTESTVISRWISHARRHQVLQHVGNQIALSYPQDIVLGRHSVWYRDWLAHPDLTDPFWSDYRYENALDITCCPVLLITGWQDAFFTQTLHQYHRLVAQGRPVELIIGPWTHANMPVKGFRLLTRRTLEWLDTYVGSWNGLCPSGSKVSIWMYQDRWHHRSNWPQHAQEQQWWFSSDHQLLPTPPQSDPRETISFTYDHRHPTPSIGGPVLGRKSGYRRSNHLLRRPDVLCFTSPVLTQDLWILGSPRITVAHQVQHCPYDIWVGLALIDHHGNSTILTDQYRRFHETTPSYEMTLTPMGARIRAGQRLAVLIAGASWPRYDYQNRSILYHIDCDQSSLVLPTYQHL